MTRTYTRTDHGMWPDRWIRRGFQAFRGYFEPRACLSGLRLAWPTVFVAVFITSFGLVAAMSMSGLGQRLSAAGVRHQHDVARCQKTRGIVEK